MICVEINVVRVDRLHPRSLLTPFTDNVVLTPAGAPPTPGRPQPNAPRASKTSMSPSRHPTTRHQNRRTRPRTDRNRDLATGDRAAGAGPRCLAKIAEHDHPGTLMP